MQDHEQKTRVSFRVGDGGVIAVFVDQTNPIKGYVGCYVHVGQHGEACPDYLMRNTRQATPAEYGDLLHELTHMVGYDVRVVKGIAQGITP